MKVIGLHLLDRLHPSNRVVRSVLVGILAGVAAGCAISTPYQATTSQRVGGGAAIVVITEATLSADRAARSAFWKGVRGVEKELPRQPGLIGYTLRQEPFGSRVWTMTTWSSEDDLRRFVSSPAHRLAIEAGEPAIADLRFARVVRERSAPPLTWSEAMDALAQGRRGDQ